jgi:hypothetical protein
VTVTFKRILFQFDAECLLQGQCNGMGLDGVTTTRKTNDGRIVTTHESLGYKGTLPH